MRAFIEELASVEPGALLTNPYRNSDVLYDIPGAPEQRIENAVNYFAAFPAPPKVLLLGEAPGPWGCRFSGIPFTSERQLVNDELPFKGKRTSIFPKPATEASASIVWGVTKPYWPNVMTWNTVPWHPWKDADGPLSIRTPLPREVDAAVPYLKAFLDKVKPGRILAVGKKAEGALAGLGIDAVGVRHPANGGAAKFREGVRSELTNLAVMGVAA